jgi:hypothetical protein
MLEGGDFKFQIPDSKRMKAEATKSDQVEAQRLVDDLCREINELYRQLREKEAECERFNRVANPEDYQ